MFQLCGPSPLKRTIATCTGFQTSFSPSAPTDTRPPQRQKNKAKANEREAIIRMQPTRAIGISSQRKLPKLATAVCPCQEVQAKIRLDLVESLLRNSEEAR